MDKKQSQSEVISLSSDAMNRLWQHGLNEYNTLNTRLNFFLIFQSFLLGIFVVVAGQSTLVYNQQVVLAVILLLGLAISLIWAYLSARQKYCLEGVRQRTKLLIPEYAQTVKARETVWWPVGNTTLIAYVIPGIFIAFWVLLTASILVS